jgi:ABC-type antimicrobial peptide transport system permease subunit
VLRLVISRGAQPIAFGLALGICGAFVLTKVLRGLLYGVGTTDPLTFGTMASILAAVALAACLAPARRATRVDPAVALRCD